MVTLFPVKQDVGVSGPTMDYDAKVGTAGLSCEPGQWTILKYRFMIAPQSTVSGFLSFAARWLLGISVLQSTISTPLQDVLTCLFTLLRVVEIPCPYKRSMPAAATVSLIFA